MGERQARRLLQAGYPVTVWNRTAQKAAVLAGDGARVAETPQQAVEEADFVITMLEGGAIVGQVLFEQGTAESLRAGATVIDMSSIRHDEACEHAGKLAARGVFYLDAPVSGGTHGAEQGTLAIMCGGDVDVFERARTLLSCMGRPTRVGAHGAGQLAKLANQIIVGATIGAVAEALLFARRGGADPASVIAALTGGFADSQILRVHGARMVDGDYTTRGRSETHLKDLNNAISTAHNSGSPTPYAQLTAELLAALIRREGDLDHSALMREFEHRAANADA